MNPAEPGRRVWIAYAVHLYTALGAVLAFLAAAALCAPNPDPRWVFFWLLLALALDASDGPLARAARVKHYAPRIQGRVLDDIVDYLTYSFIPLLLVWRMDWLAGPDLLWVAPALVASLLGFAHTGAKQEEAGFFRGFPSYWNLVAYFIGWLAVVYAPGGRVLATALVVVLSLLTVLPLRVVYPNRAPHPWRGVLLVGGCIWFAWLLVLLPAYPHFPAWMSPHWLFGITLVYPAFYAALSVALARRHQRLAGVLIGPGKNRL